MKTYPTNAERKAAKAKKAQEMAVQFELNNAGNRTTAKERASIRFNEEEVEVERVEIRLELNGEIYNNLSDYNCARDRAYNKIR